MSTIVTPISGFVLLFASALKFSIACHGCPQFCVFGSCTANIALACLETIVGLIIVSAYSFKLRNRMAIATYSGLFIASIVFVAFGNGSCGCFGFLTPTPIVVSVIDGTLLMLLIWTTDRNFQQQARTAKNYPSMIFIGLGILVVTTGLCLNLLVRNNLAGHGFMEIRGVVILQPDSWNVDYPEEIFEEIGINLTSDDQVTIIFVQGNCEHCSKYLLNYQARRANLLETLVVVLPPNGETTDMVVRLGLNHLIYEGRKTIVLPTPWRIHVDRGKVVESEYAKPQL